MPRSLTTKNLYQKKTGKTIKLESPVLSAVIGEAEAKGIWLIYGSEKNGKTWFTLKLAKDLAKNQTVAFVSAEEGTDKSFTDAVKRAGITPADRIKWDEYLSIDEIKTKHQKPKAPKVIVMDNATIWADELKTNGIRKLSEALPDVLIILIAHEERKQPVPSCAKFAQKMAKVIINVKGFEAFVVSRFSLGGQVTIDIEKSEMYWGSKK